MFGSLRSRHGSKWAAGTLVSALVLALLAFQPGMSRAEIAPVSLEATLMPGETAHGIETVTVNLPPTIPKADILFSFDLTGSMGGVLSTAKAKAGEIMAQLDGLIDDAQYGVVSHMDYSGSYSSFGYSNVYGNAEWGDYPYRLDRSITADRIAVSTAINGLTLANGVDWPESYTRVLYESYADSNIAWRDGARRIVIMFGDSLPHDNNPSDGVSGLGGWAVSTTGGDPGRDAVIGTADDLDLQATLAAMAANGVILFPVWSGSSYLPYWEHYAALTGGDAFLLSNTADLPAVIEAAISSSAAHVNNLSLKASPGFESWIAATPVAYTDLATPATVSFSVDVTVPAGTVPGDYHFTISAIGDGASFGDQSVLIHVPACTPEPSVSFKAPLSAGSIYDLPAGAILPIRFGFGSCTTPFIHDESVIIQIQDPTNPDFPVATWVYGYDIVIDDVAGEYQQNFDPTPYELVPGTLLDVQVFIADQFVGVAQVRVH